jgi:hypothetical protein
VKGGKKKPSNWNKEYVQVFLLGIKTLLKMTLFPLSLLSVKKVCLKFIFPSFITLELHLCLPKMPLIYDIIRSETAS